MRSVNVVTGSSSLMPYMKIEGCAGTMSEQESVLHDEWKIYNETDAVGNIVDLNASIVILDKCIGDR